MNLEANGIVRYSDGHGSVGIEFTEMLFCGSVIRHKPKSLLIRVVLPGIAVSSLALALYLTPPLHKFLPKWKSSPEAVSQTVSQKAPEVAASFFTLGSPKVTVQAVQGPPTTATDSVWTYRFSKVYFRADHVIGWSISPDTPLKVGTPEPKSTETKASHYGLGSSAVTVLAIEGSPTELTENVWRYGKSEVYFRNGRVVGWKSSPKRPLKCAVTR